MDPRVHPKRSQEGRSSPCTQTWGPRRTNPDIPVHTSTLVDKLAPQPRGRRQLSTGPVGDRRHLRGAGGAPQEVSKRQVQSLHPNLGAEANKVEQMGTYSNTCRRAGSSAEGVSTTPHGTSRGSSTPQGHGGPLVDTRLGCTGEPPSPPSLDSSRLGGPRGQSVIFDETPHVGLFSPSQFKEVPSQFRGHRGIATGLFLPGRSPTELRRKFLNQALPG